MNSATGIAGHGASMDRMYRYQRYIYDASRAYYLPGRDRLIDGLDVPDGESVLEIGCGTGRNLIRVAKAYPHARVHGLDISREMLKTARTAIEKAGLEGRIGLGLGDATVFNPEVAFRRKSFARIFFSYTLSMVPDWLGALERAASLLPPGGELHIVDFGNGDGLPGWSRQALLYWLGCFGVAPRLELNALAAPIESHGIGSWRTHPMHRGYAVKALLKRSLTGPAKGMARPTGVEPVFTT